MAKLSTEEKEHLIEKAVEFERLDTEMQRMIGIMAELLKVASGNKDNHDKETKGGE